MLEFDVYRNGAPVEKIDLNGAYLFGQDGIPVRADIAFGNGRVSCVKRVPGACGLSLLWDAGHSGRLLLPTTRLPDRSRPYNLNLELARARMMQIYQKREDWGLFDYRDAEPLNEEFRQIHKKFIAAMQAPDPSGVAKLADEALAAAITLSEKIALFHADIFLSRRKASNLAVSRTGFGCAVNLLNQANDYRARIREVFDFTCIPMPWKHAEPKEGQYHYDEIDAWVNWTVQARKPIHAGPLLSFDPDHLPDWTYLWEHDYDALRELIYEHIQRIVRRYAKQVRIWRVVAGIHAQNSFHLNFEQLMELTRMSCLLVKTLAPESVVMIELVLPWGEYYARNQQTIPPMLYADMAVQSGIKFDAFGLQVHMGVPIDGHYVRDLMQISSLLDEFVGLDKAVHVTACQVPSDMAADPQDHWSGEQQVVKAGRWHAPWSQRLQAEWLQAFYRIAISKPFINTICWRDLADQQEHYLSHGGLCRGDLEPKLAYRELRNFKAAMVSAVAGVIDQQNRKNNNLSKNQGK